VNKINFSIDFILFNPQVYVVFALFHILVVLCFLLIISIMSVSNKTIGSNSGGGKQTETQGSMIGQERLIFRQIPMSGGTEIKPSTANMEKGLTYRYILP